MDKLEGSQENGKEKNNIHGATRREGMSHRRMYVSSIKATNYYREPLRVKEQLHTRICSVLAYAPE